MGIDIISLTSPVKREMSTRAIAFLRHKAIAFDVVRYRHEEKGARYAADAIGFPLARTVKTLVVDLGDGRYRLALMPGHRRLSLKRMARVLNVKRAAMADVPTAQRLTGYLVGGISPFGVKHPLPAVMDTSIAAHPHIAINAGQRGTMLIMAPEDIPQAIDCKIATIAEDDPETFPD